MTALAKALGIVVLALVAASLFGSMTAGAIAAGVVALAVSLWRANKVARAHAAELAAEIERSRPVLVVNNMSAPAPTSEPDEPVVCTYCGTTHAPGSVGRCSACRASLR